MVERAFIYTENSYLFVIFLLTQRFDLREQIKNTKRSNLWFYNYTKCIVV